MCIFLKVVMCAQLLFALSSVEVKSLRFAGNSCVGVQSFYVTKINMCQSLSCRLLLSSPYYDSGTMGKDRLITLRGTVCFN